MFPEICKIGPFTIYSYGLALVLAFGISYILASYQAKKQKIPVDILFNFLFIAFIFGIIGSRIFYVVENLAYYKKNPWEIIMLQRGGLSWFGGLILGQLCAIAYLMKRRLTIYKFLDLVAPYLALGQAIGRVGCLLNGCCFGKASEKFGIYFGVHNEILIPTQIYSSLFLILIFILLRLLQDRPHKEGQVFFTYLLFYALKRFFIEFWRADNEIVFHGLTLFQLISIAIFILSLIKLLSLKISKS